MKWLLLSIFIAGKSYAGEVYRYEEETKASDYAKEFFGPAGVKSRAPGLDMGRYRAGVSSKIDCGSLDIQGNLRAEFENLQRQVKELLSQNAIGLVQKGAMMATCYAYPTVCAQLRHDFLALQSTLNLRAQACKAMDDFIDSSAEKGAKQLRAEAQAECTKERVSGGESLSSAMRECQSLSGLPLRDFQSGLEKRFVKGRQKVLESMAKFAKSGDGVTYDFLAGVLGEIEVQEDGYWQPLFTKGMLRPHEVAGGFLAEGESRLCGERGFDDAGVQGDVTRLGVYKVTKERITQDDFDNLNDLEKEDRRLACAALGRSIGQMAAERALAEGEAVLASGLLNTAIPNSLRDEYRSRGQTSFDALRKALASDQIPPLDEVRRAVGLLAKATREKNRILASEITRGRLQNYRDDAAKKFDCTDTLSCSGGG